MDGPTKCHKKERGGFDEMDGQKKCQKVEMPLKLIKCNNIF